MKLNQLIAVEKGIKGKVQADLDEAYKIIQKPALFDGFIKVYKKRAEDEEDIPQQRQKVQFSVEEMLKAVEDRLATLLDVTMTKDLANTFAVADVVVEGETVLTGAPATYLLFLEKQLTDLRTMLEKLPVLDAAEEWKEDQGTGLFRTEPTETHRTKKVQKPLVLYQATDKHPAQTQLITEDVTVGFWQQTKYSGAVPAQRRRQLVERADKLLYAVKFAREKANLAEAKEQKVGSKLLNWIFRK